MFGLYPNNSNRQYMIVSEEYNAKEEIVEALKLFKCFVEKNINNMSVVSITQKDNRYTFAFEDKEKNKIYSHFRWYDTKVNCNKGVTRIFENYDAEIK